MKYIDGNLNELTEDDFTPVKELGKWWTGLIDVVEIDGKAIALDGWNGSAFYRCFEVDSEFYGCYEGENAVNRVYFETVRNIPEAVYPVYNLAENENDEVDIKGYYIGIS